MIKVSVLNTEVRNMKGIAKVSGKPYDMNFQTAYAYTYGKDGQLNPFPEKIELTLDSDSQGQPKVYAKGDYQLHPASLYVGKYGLEVAPRLVVLKA